MTDAEDILRAIGAGEIDAFVVSDGGTGRRVSTLPTADWTYRMFVENMHDGAATVSSNGVILYANKRLAMLLSSTRDTIVGSPLAQFMASSSPIGLEQLGDTEGLGTAIEMNLVTAHGTTVPVLVGMSPLEMDGGRVTCMTFTDLSVQKALDSEIARLGKVQRERMADLHDAQAAITKASEQSRDEALAQSEVKSQFLATMSHEIRTPMNGVIGLASLLLSTDLNPAQARYTAGIHTAGNALLRVINDILDFSKIEADKLVLDIDDFDLPGVLIEIGALINPTAQHQGLTMVTRSDPKLPTMVRGDSGRLRQVLLNLVGNAVKFTPRGGVTLRVAPDSAATSEPDTVRVRFEVSDTGIGIAPADAERLFEPFTQADPSTTRAYGGTGLGLAICRQLTEAMGGTIGVDSALGQGSTFWLVIPFGPALRHDPHIKASPAADTTKLRVLVVDTGTAQTLLLDRLHHWMMTSAGADNAPDALQALRQAAARGSPFDVMIIDADLIEVVALTHQITSDPDIRTVHIIVLNHDPSTDFQTTTDGLSYLTKPVHESSLYNCLTKTIPGPPPAVADPRRPDPVAAAPTPQQQRRILLAEDNDINQMVVVGILTGLGYHVIVANDGIEAVNLAEADNYDAVLMDCRMPRMDGFSATNEIRRRQGDGRHTPIIAITASAQMADREACLAAGMDDYLTKPVNPAELESTLNRWIPGSVTTTAPDSAMSPDDDPLTRRLDELRGTNTEPERVMVNRLIVSFLNRAPRYLTTLADAVAAADAAALEEHAHSFKGAAGNVGAVGAAQICQRLETIGRTGQVDPTATEDLDQLRTEIKSVDIRLRIILQQLHPYASADHLH